MNRMLVIALSLMALPGFLLADDHSSSNGYVVESIPFKLKEGSTMADMMGLAPQFAKLGKKGKFQYSSYILTPHYITKSTAAVASDYDGVWLGFSPDNKSMTSAVSYYLKNGMDLENNFGEVRIMNQRMLMRGEQIHDAGIELDSDDSGYTVIRTCSLNEGSDMDDFRAAAKRRSDEFNEAGLTVEPHIWHSGFGIPNELQGKMLLVFYYPDMAEWAKLGDMYFDGKFSQDTQEMVAKAVTCGPARSYLTSPFYTVSN